MYAKILVALDGSRDSLIGGRIALELARNLGAEFITTHIYDAGLHSDRFGEMEPVLPDRYQREEELQRLRDAHEELISEGFAALSEGYLEEFTAMASKKGVSHMEIHKEGRNYVKILELVEEQDINLVVVGAAGLAQVDDQLGSTSARVVRLAKCDVLIARKEWSDDAAIISCVDGSNQADASLRKAIQWSRTFSRPLHVLAAYDPQFHTNVFRKMGSSLSDERQSQIGLAKQEKLHDQIIDDGLGDLYATFLDRAIADADALGIKAEKKLLQGKANKVITDTYDEIPADLVVVGRYGHHRNDMVPIGATSEAIVRNARTNVLVTKAVSAAMAIQREESAITWDEEALGGLQRVPEFARSMARGAVENRAREAGVSHITLAFFKEIAGSFGMGKTL